MQDYNTYSGAETDQLEQMSLSGSSSDEGTFYEYSYRMFYLSRFAANSNLWNAWTEYFNGILKIFFFNLYDIEYSYSVLV